MRPTRRPRSLLTALLAAGALSLALAASAAAVVWVYSNGFNSRSAVQDTRKLPGGPECDRSFRSRSDSMGLRVTGQGLCRYSPLVVGEQNRPDHVVLVRGRVTSDTPKSLRRGAYLALQVRAGGGGFYELQVRPRVRRFRLLRQPGSDVVAAAGRSGAIKPVNKKNTLILMVDGARVKAKVNGRRLASIVDPNPDDLSGRRVAFGLGSRRDSNRAVVGRFDLLRVGLP